MNERKRRKAREEAQAQWWTESATRAALQRYREAWVCSNCGALWPSSCSCKGPSGQEATFGVLGRTFLRTHPRMSLCAIRADPMSWINVRDSTSGHTICKMHYNRAIAAGTKFGDFSPSLDPCSICAVAAHLPHLATV